VAVITIMDLVMRKWICEVVSGEETSTQSSGRCERGRASVNAVACHDVQRSW